MFRLRRWYNQNSKTIWKVTGIVVFLIIILQVLNYFAGKNNKIEYSSNTINLPQKDYTDLSLESDKSVLSNNKISSIKSDPIKVINDFFAFCNEGKIKEAYELLTDECKKQMYPELKIFREGYYKTVFNGVKKDISLANWVGDIYKVEIRNDILSTGKYDENDTRQDYITVKSIGDNTYKLNINEYIDTNEINKTNTFFNNIQINVEKKDVYMDYEIYTFKIKNNMDTPILIDNLKDIDSMYLTDKNNIKYSAYTHEISLSELLINARETREVKIKYYNKYGSEKIINNIVFSKVIVDYYSYWYQQDKNTFNNYRMINIEL